ncbi:hypothetical protein LINGRAHAP2_LOCUS20385 [Linum grandiflorum]
MKMVSGFTPRPLERFRGMLIVEDDGEEMGLRWWDDGEVIVKGWDCERTRRSVKVIE